MQDSLVPCQWAKSLEARSPQEASGRHGLTCLIGLADRAEPPIPPSKGRVFYCLQTVKKETKCPVQLPARELMGDRRALPHWQLTSGKDAKSEHTHQALTAGFVRVERVG